MASKTVVQGSDVQFGRAAPSAVVIALAGAERALWNALDGYDGFVRRWNRAEDSLAVIAHDCTRELANMARGFAPSDARDYYAREIEQVKAVRAANEAMIAATRATVDFYEMLTSLGVPFPAPYRVVRPGDGKPITVAMVWQEETAYQLAMTLGFDVVDPVRGPYRIGRGSFALDATTKYATQAEAEEAAKQLTDGGPISVFDTASGACVSVVTPNVVPMFAVGEPNGSGDLSVVRFGDVASADAAIRKAKAYLKDHAETKSLGVYDRTGRRVCTIAVAAEGA